MSSRKALFKLLRLATRNGRPTIRIIPDETVERGTAKFMLNDEDAESVGGVKEVEECFRTVQKNLSLTVDDNGNPIGFFGNLMSRGLDAAIGGVKQKVRFGIDLKLAQLDVEHWEKNQALGIKDDERND